MDAGVQRGGWSVPESTGTVTRLRFLNAKRELAVASLAQDALVPQSIEDARRNVRTQVKQPGGLGECQRQPWHVLELAVNSTNERVTSSRVATFSGNCRRQTGDGGNQRDVQNGRPPGCERFLHRHTLSRNSNSLGANVSGFSLQVRDIEGEA